MSGRTIRILDGGMGTMLQALGLPLGGVPEVWNITEPERIQSVHEAYLSAGSE
ncbi:MAG: homocysteine S-methyltransferase family protein, partial [Lachnospiraceae bacterium]|nr:homocysteine S-methyltransferase family protein [Lachnospiraceae bacterium]